MISLFAIIGQRKDKPKVRQLTFNLKDQATLFGKVKLDEERLRGDRAEVEFEPGYKPPEDEVMYLHFELPDALKNLSTSYEDLEHATEDELKNRSCRALVAHEHDTDSLYFYVVDSKNYLAHRTIWFLDWTSENRVASIDGITLSDNLAAVYDDEHLYFTSEWLVGRLFDLAPYVSEATKPQVEKLFQHSIFDGSVSANDVYHLLTAPQKRKLHIILTQGILDHVDPKDAYKKAQSMNVPLTRRKGKLVLPKDKAELREVIWFLDERIYESALRPGVNFVSAGKRPR